MAVNAVDWNQLAPFEPYPGMRGRRFDTAHATVIRYELDPGASHPIHSHAEEQLVHIIDGEIDFTVGGRVLRLGAGQMVHVPAHVPHGATGAGQRPAVFLNIVMPPRS